MSITKYKFRCYFQIDTKKQLISGGFVAHLGINPDNVDEYVSTPLVKEEMKYLKSGKAHKQTVSSKLGPYEHYMLSIEQINEVLEKAPKPDMLSQLVAFISQEIIPLFNPVAAPELPIVDSELATVEKPETMSSLQIAELTGKRHSDVIRDIKNVLNQLNIDERKFASIYLDAYKREKPCYNLNEELTLTLTSGYSIPQRNAIIKEWQAHRRGEVVAAPVQQPTELTRKDLILLALKAEEEIEELQAENQRLNKTKHLISTNREASVMGKLGRANDKIKWQEEQISQLESRLQATNSTPEYQYATILAIQSRLKYIKVSGLKLTYYCNNNGLAMKQIPDDRFGFVHSYPAQAWKDVYQIDINAVLNKVA